MNSGGNGLRGPGVDSDVYRMALPRPGVSPRESVHSTTHQGPARLGRVRRTRGLPCPAGWLDQAAPSSPAPVSPWRAVRMRRCAVVTAAKACRTCSTAPARSVACAQPATYGRV